MIHYKARQQRGADGQGTGVWKYTAAQGDRVFEVGYCSATELCPDCAGQSPYRGGAEAACARCGSTGLIPAANPCPGHATAAEACQHYKQYLLDQAKFFGPKTTEWPKEKCEVDDCSAEATHCAAIPGEFRRWQLCAAHANRDQLDKLLSVGESWRS